MSLVTAIVGERARRRAQLVTNLSAALAGQLGVVDGVRARGWRDGWVGTPSRLRLAYAPAVDEAGVDWLPDLLRVVSQRTGARYRVMWQDARRCLLSLELASEELALPTPEETPAGLVRAERMVRELLGVGADVAGEWLRDELVALEVNHEAGIRIAGAAQRARIERTVSTMLPGRWRALWDLEDDHVRFEVRPTLPGRVDHPVNPVTEDTYWELPYAVDEDGRHVTWSLRSSAGQPHLLPVGATGAGKSLALDTPVPTPSGWTTMGQLRGGDTVYDDQGQPCTVMAAHPVRHGRPCYRVGFSDGSHVVADAEHLWWTSSRQERVSRQRAARLRVDDARPRRMTIEQLNDLEAAVAAARDGDTITAPEAARLARIRPTARILHKLGRDVPPCGDRPRLVHDFAYAEQVVRQEQRVNLYARQQVLRGFAEVVKAGTRQPTTVSPARLVALAATSGPDEMISKPRLRPLLELDQRGLRALMRRVQVPYVHQRETLARAVPAHVARRRLPGPPGRLYPRRQYLEALAAWGRGRVKDGLPIAPSGSVRTTEEIAATLHCPTGHVNHGVPVAAPLDCPNAELPLAPYALGVWAGDGTSWRPEYTSADPEIALHLQMEGIDVVDRGRPACKPASYAAHTYAMRSPVRQRLDELGLLRGADPTRRGRVKHIPPVYLRASIDQRRALLAGLMDTDGTVYPRGTCQFTNTNEQLARDVHELACSLGYRATITGGRARLNGRDCGPKWTVSWTTTERVFRLERKHLLHKERTARCAPERLRHRYITTVEPVPSVPVRCVTVDSPSRLYLVGRSFIPTHNTVLINGVVMEACRRGWEVWVCDPKRIEFLGLRSWPNVRMVATTVEEQVAVIHRMWAVMEDRYELIESGERTEDDFEPVVLVLDEYRDFYGAAAEWYSSIKVRGMPSTCPVFEKVASIARKGRSARVHVILGTQRPDAAFLGGEMRDNFRARVSLGRLSPQGAVMMWDAGHIGVSLPKRVPGRATAVGVDDRPVEVQTYWTPDPRRVRADQADDVALLARLRPAEVTHPAMVVVPPEPRVDEKLGPVDPGYHDWAAAVFVDARHRPDLVRGSSRLREPAEQAEVDTRLLPAAARDADDSFGADFGESSGNAEVDLAGGDDYGPTEHVAVEHLEPGDLVLLDDAGRRWAVVEAAEQDVLDSGSVCVDWRDDDDEAGSMSWAENTTVTIRRPLDVEP